MFSGPRLLAQPVHHWRPARALHRQRDEQLKLRRGSSHGVAAREVIRQGGDEGGEVLSPSLGSRSAEKETLQKKKGPKGDVQIIPGD